jgi:lipopolysaccharide heptosyltransferase I
LPRQIKNPRPLPERSGPRIALIRLSAIGDVIHALPCATALRRAQPNAHIAWIAEPAPAQLLSRHPDLDAVITMPRRRWRRLPRRQARRERAIWFRHLRAEGFDIAIDLQGLWKSARVARATFAPDRYCFGDDQARELSWFGVPRSHRITPPPEAKHVIQRYLSVLRPLGVGSLEPTWRFAPISDEAHVWLMDWWSKLDGFDDRPWVALNPGAGWETKRWPVGHFAELAERIESDLGARAIFLWGPGDEPLREKLNAQHRGERFTHAPDNDLQQLFALLHGISAFVGGDTGPTHLAAALGVPCASPHGGSDWVRNGPFGEEQVSLALEEIPCVPCWRTTCNYVKRLECLERLPVSRVFETVATQLERPGRRQSPQAFLREVLSARSEPAGLSEEPESTLHQGALGAL